MQEGAKVKGGKVGGGAGEEQLHKGMMWGLGDIIAHGAI